MSNHLKSQLSHHLWPDTAAIGANNRLHIGGCDLTALAAEYGTPLYLLDETTLRGTMRAYAIAFATAYPGVHGVHYASKALLNTALAQIVAQEGLGLDVVSGTELLVARRAGMAMERIHFHGNAKTRAELERALEWRVGAIVVDSLDELEQLVTLSDTRSPDAYPTQGVLLRLAPGIDAHTHAHIATGGVDSKFGLPLEAVEIAARRVLATQGLRLLGLHAHIGSQIFESAPLQATIGVLLDMAARLRDRLGFTVEEISPGGGLGAPYTHDDPPTDIAAYAATLSSAMRDGCAARNLPLPRLTVEPGRSIVARAGVAIYTVVATKSRPVVEASQTAAVDYVHIDGGMADNLRPALYGARYTALLANRAAEAPSKRVNVAGRYCESGDVLLRGVLLPPAQPGDQLAVAVAGAYTLSMANNYNLVPRPALLLLHNGATRVIQRRETEEEVLGRDVALFAEES
jgi:diaminopimelate decarboxylase